MEAGAVPYEGLRGERHELLGYRVVEMRDGLARLTWTPGERLTNPMGFVHGGFVATIIDDCCGCAVMSRLDQLVPFPTVNLHVDFLRGIRIGATFTCFGSVVRMGRRVTIADTRVEDASGQLMARGTCTFALDATPR